MASALLTALSLWASTPAFAQTSTVTVLSPKAILEPCTNTAPCDKDGYPPTSSNADPEEGTLGAKLVVGKIIVAPRLVVTDDNSTDRIDDLRINEPNATATGVTRDIDYLDGLIDGQLRAGTYYVYFNLDKTNYDTNLPTSSATINKKGNTEKYTVSLQGTGFTAVAATTTINLEGSASIDQNDLRWLETGPGTVQASVGDIFIIRTKYSHQSAGALDSMILQSYYQGRALRLEQVNLYYYDTNGAETPSIKNLPAGCTTQVGSSPLACVPVGYQRVYLNQPDLPFASQPATLSSGDRWVGEFVFKVVGKGGSRFVPYFQTKPSTTSNWKLDTGYQNFQVEPPGQINPAVLTINKTFGATKVISGSEPPLVGSTTTYELVLNVANTGLDNSVNTTVTDVIPAGVQFASNFVASQGTSTWDAATSKITWTVGTLAADPDGAAGPLAGGTATLRFRVSVTPTASQAGTTIFLNNGALTSGNSQASNLAVSAGPSNALQTTAIVAGTPMLTVKKSVNKTSALPGDQLVYTIGYANTGNAAASGVVISDPLPSRTTFISATGGGTNTNGTVTWNIGTVNAGASGSVTLTVVLDATFPGGTTIVNNTATLSATGVSSLAGSTSTSVSASQKLSITKVISATTRRDVTVTNVATISSSETGALAPTAPVVTSDTALATITYNIVVANAGANADAKDLTVRDVLPAGVTFVSSTGGTYDAATRTVTWSIATLAANATQTFQLAVRVQ